MARPVTIPDEQILEAARAVFTEKGPRATTAEIAERAGVSEGILFKRFGNKAGLHKVAMSSEVAGAWIRKEMRALAPLRTQQDLERFIRWQLDALRNVVPVVIMAWSFRGHVGALPADLAGSESAPLVALRTLAALLEEENAAGQLAVRDPLATAQILTGSVWYFVFLELLLGPDAATKEDTFVQELARTVLSDLQPTAQPAAKSVPAAGPPNKASRASKASKASEANTASAPSKSGSTASKSNTPGSRASKSSTASRASKSSTASQPSKPGPPRKASQPRTSR